MYKSCDCYQDELTQHKKMKHKDIQKYLKDSENQYSIPLQNIITQEATDEKLPKIKLISVAELQTLAYEVKSFTKPISKIFIEDER